MQLISVLTEVIFPPSKKLSHLDDSEMNALLIIYILLQQGPMKPRAIPCAHEGCTCAHGGWQGRSLVGVNIFNKDFFSTERHKKSTLHVVVCSFWMNSGFSPLFRRPLRWLIWAWQGKGSEIFHLCWTPTKNSLCFVLGSTRGGFISQLQVGSRWGCELWRLVNCTLSVIFNICLKFNEQAFPLTAKLFVLQLFQLLPCRNHEDATQFTPTWQWHHCGHLWCVALAALHFFFHSFNVLINRKQPFAGIWNQYHPKAVVESFKVQHWNPFNWSPSWFVG